MKIATAKMGRILRNRKRCSQGVFEGGRGSDRHRKKVFSACEKELFPAPPGISIFPGEVDPLNLPSGCIPGNRHYFMNKVHRAVVSR
jgi:hypothetical protein